MNSKTTSIRPFIGARNFEESTQFYRHWGFTEHIIDKNMYLYQTDHIGFYLQNAYVQEWVDNTMLFLEVKDLDQYWNELNQLQFVSKFEGVRLSGIRTFDWGRECYLHDPSGILWHIGEFKTSTP